MLEPLNSTEKTEEGIALYLALLHHPVLNKCGKTIGSAVTNLDIHDIARMARTYGVSKYFIATPYSDQHQLVNELIAHWTEGSGGCYNPARKEALQRVELATSLDEVIEKITQEKGVAPLVISTSAKRQTKSIEYKELRCRIQQGETVLLLFGTAHGLTDDVMLKTDMTLPPISGGTTYNHLAVRSAASIIVDRLLGC